MKFLSTIFIFTSLFIFTNCSDTNKVTIDDLKKSIEEQFEGMDGDFAYAFLNLAKPNEFIHINVNEKFHAASTMKVPVMIEIFKQAADDKFDLTDSIEVKNEFKSIVDGSVYSMDINDDSGEGLYKMINKKLTINDLMYEMITMSSNLATNILVELVDAKKVTSNMKTIGANNMIVLRGVEDIKAYEKGLSNSTTAEDLMVIMQSIANGTAGNAVDCQQMVHILKAQHFNDMIPKYYPENVEVAHKTGSITGVHHDSGIIYLPDGRSFVLVMLSKKLKAFDKATDMMAKISKETLDFMTQ